MAQVTRLGPYGTPVRQQAVASKDEGSSKQFVTMPQFWAFGPRYLFGSKNLPSSGSKETVTIEVMAGFGPPFRRYMHIAKDEDGTVVIEKDINVRKTLAEAGTGVSKRQRHRSSVSRYG